MPPYVIPVVLCVGLAFMLFALADYGLWELRHWWAERESRKWEEAHNKE